MTLIFLLLCAAGAVWSVKKFYESLNMSLTKLNEKPIATITFKHKTAQRKFMERMIWDRLRQHSPVYDGDTIRTAPESEATIYFEDGNVMDLGENTMAQVFFHDGQVQMSVSGGSFSVNSSGSKNGAVVNAGNSSVVVSAGSSIGASVSEESGTSFKVVDGTVVFTDENGLARAMEKGEAIALDASGDEQIIPIITVFSPAPNAKVLDFGGSGVSVDFKWTAQNLEKGDSLVLQTSREKDFSDIERTVDLDGMTEVSVDFEEGVSYWRVYAKKAGVNYSAASKLKVFAAPPPQLIAPESRSVYTYKSKLPDVRFSWSANDLVTAFDLQIADNPQMENPIVEQRATTPSSIVSTLGTGTWYWRVTPYYTLNKIGLAEPSEVRAFTINQRNKILPPELILPAAGDNVNTALKDMINFSWKNNPEAVGYEIAVSADPKCLDNMIVQKTKSNFFVVKPSESRMQEGTWYWRVIQYDADGDISDQSEIRKFTTSQVKFEQRALYPPDNFAVTDTNLAELRFTWKSNIPGDNRFQIARDKKFTSLVVNQIDNEKFFQGAQLSGGDYYWRISSATLPDQYSTEPRAFKVVSQLTAPVLATPADQETLTIYGESSTRFSWKPVAGADLYQFNLYDTENKDTFIVSERVKRPLVAVNMAKYSNGTYGWSVQALAEETLYSSRRFSPMSDAEFRIVQLRRAVLEYPADGAVIDGVRALSNPETVRWSCEQELKQSTFTLSKNPNGYSNPIMTVNNPGRAIKLPRLDPGVYYWTIRGANASGANSSAAKPRSFTVGRILNLAAPRITSPAAGKVYGPAQIRVSRRIDFAWNPVPLATNYTITIRNDRGEVLVSKTLKENRFTIPDMAELKRGRFAYTVQASQLLPDGTLVRRGDISSSAFTIDLPVAGDIIIDDTGVLYGK
ncbi:MAG: FecR domain-containing protein [Treponema sp.]|nr:FecR domain-containing protein [Treponema sp.]MEE3434005.1 FecR domain-containing protein [Treponema sp.]